MIDNLHPLSQIFDSLHYSYMQRALVAGAAIGALCAIVGVYVVLRGLSFIGAGISHSSFAGVAIGVALGVNPVISAAIFCILTAIAIGYFSRNSKIKEDTAVGIFFAFTMALGILILGMLNGYQKDLFSYLFGNIITIGAMDLRLAIFALITVSTIVWILYKDLMYITFDPDAAELSGMPTAFLYYLLLSIMALTIVVSIKIVGIVLVSALIVSPAAAAHLLTERFNKMMALSILFGSGSSILGLIIADILSIAPGAAIVIASTCVFFVCFLVSKKKRNRSDCD